MLAVGVMCVASFGAPSVALASDATLDLYFSAPFVQGSEVSGGASQDFNAFPTGATACATSWGAVGTATGDCRVDTVQGHGGATAGATDPTPTVGGAGSKFPATEWVGTGVVRAITTTFTSSVKYVGFWWSAGNGASGPNEQTNKVEFYSGETKVATMTAEDVTNILGTVPNPYPGTDTIETVSQGGPYLRGYYFGNPRGFPNTSPVAKSSYTSDAIFVYLNLFVDGDYSIDRMVISGDGFEFDNVVTSTTAQTPAGNLVLAKRITVTQPPGPSPDNGGSPGLPDTGIAILTFTGIALLGAFLFLLAGGAFSSRTRLHLLGVDVEVREKLDRLSQSLTRMERKRRRIRPRSDN